jgi:hypothetical protein
MDALAGPHANASGLAEFEGLVKVQVPLGHRNT